MSRTLASVVGRRAESPTTGVPPPPTALLMFRQSGMLEITAMSNGPLQGGDLIMGALALELDCGPMPGFDNAALSAPGRSPLA